MGTVARAHLPGEDLVQGQVLQSGAHLRGDHLPLVVAPARGLGQCTAHGNHHGSGVEAEQHGVARQRRLDPGRHLLRTGVLVQTGEGGVDVRERLVGLEEEVAVDGDLGQPVVVDGEVRDHQLPAEDLVLSVCS